MNNEVRLSSEAEIDEYFVQHLRNSGSAFMEFPGLKETLRDEFKVIEYPKPPKGSIGLIIPKICWVIKNDDFQILESILDGFKNAAGANFFMTAASPQVATVSTTAAIGIVTTMYKLFKSINNKGTQLTKMQFQVIVCLKNNSEGLAFDQILQLLNLTEEKVTKENLLEIISSMMPAYSRNGSKLDLVIKENNIYRVAGV